jgi:hypothetical protein
VQAIIHVLIQAIIHAEVQAASAGLQRPGNRSTSAKALKATRDYSLGCKAQVTDKKTRQR